MTPDDSVDAAELALGLIEGEERAAALRRMLADPAFAREVERWRDHFASLLTGIASVEPPDLAALPAANDRDDARGWRWATAGASAIAAALALVVVARPDPAPSPPAPRAAPALPLTAALAPVGAGTPVAALYDRSGGEVRIAAGVAVPPGKVAQLWRIGADKVPHALGLLRPGSATAIALSPTDRAALAAGATLAISIEPPGGSPKATPTGPVVAAGTLIAI